VSALALAVLAASASSQTPSPPVAVEWTVDSLTRIGGHAVTVVGRPRVVDTSRGRAVEFDGAGDGLFIESNPLEGLARFTVEVVLDPAADGPEEQRFLHIEERDSRRALMELRRLAAGVWCLDTFLRDGDSQLTLIDRGALHRPGEWHVAALAYDGAAMTHYVDGMREASGPVAFAPLGSGRTSIGVRQNRVSWFKGRIRMIRITPQALPPDRLLFLR